MNNKPNQDRPSGLSIASLVTGILAMLPLGSGLPLGIAAIVCGAIDLNRIKAGKCCIAGKGMDIAGIILGSVAIVATVALIIVSLVLVFSGAFDWFGDWGYLKIFNF